MPPTQPGWGGHLATPGQRVISHLLCCSEDPIQGLLSKSLRIKSSQRNWTMVNYLISISKDGDKRSNTRRPATQMNSCVWQDQLIKLRDFSAHLPLRPSLPSCPVSRSPTTLPFLFGSTLVFAESLLTSRGFPLDYSPISCASRNLEALFPWPSWFLISISSDQLKWSELTG